MTTAVAKPKEKKLTKTQLKRIEEQEMQYEFAKMWLRNDYSCITTISELKRVLKKFGDEFAMDTETSGLDIRPGKTELFGISLSNNEAEAYWIPNPTDKMKQMLQTKMKTSRVILAKADYDIPILENNGIEVVDFVDIFIPVHLLYPNERLGGLKGTADKLLTGIGETLLLNKLLGKSKTEIEYGDFNKLEDWVQLAYAAQDADITWRLWELDKIKEIETKYPVIWKLEHDLVRPLIHMKLSGIKIDIDLIKEQDIVLEQARTKIVEKVNKIASKKSGEKIELNLNSSQQKADFLFGSFIKPKEKGAKGRHRKSDALIGLDGKPLVPLERTESGRGSTMKKFMNSIKSKHPAVELILQASSLASLRSNFTNKIPNIMDDDGKLRTSFWALGAATGRFTSSGPNLQNAPKSQADYIPVNIRNCFIADKDYVLLDIDYAQIELRLAASFSGEPVWIKAFESGESPHVATAIEMFGKKYTEDEYKKSKN
ncbi:MAG: DNA polymerase, partial [Nitrosopumilus sp.]